MTPPLSVPFRDAKEMPLGAGVLSPGVGGLGMALKELHRRPTKTGGATKEGRRSNPTKGRVTPGRPQEVPRV